MDRRALNLSEVLDRILVNLERVVPHDAAEVLMIEGGFARVMRCRGAGIELTDELIKRRIPIQKTHHLSRMVETRQPVVIADMEGDPNGTKISLGTDQHWRSYVGAPIQLNGEIIGFINLGSLTANFFTLAHADRLEAFAEQAAIAIENTQLREQERALTALHERERLARELHDAVSQTLFSANLIAESLPRQWQRYPERVEARLRDLAHLTRGAMAEMRVLLLELRPASLLEVEITTLLRQLAEAVQSRKRMAIQVQMDEGIWLPPEVKLVFYRIAQEAINNITKHARATQATLCLEKQDGSIRLILTDNGQGFEPQSVRPTSLGLSIMQERADEIGATLTIDTTIGQGTRIALVWPEAVVQGVAADPARPHS